MYSKATPQEQTQDPKYPCLMIGKDGKNIVLFHGNGKGMVVGLPTAMYCQGYYSAKWDMDTFAPYNGTVTLSNTKID